MIYSLIWLPRVLSSAGLQVIPRMGWETRGHGDMGTVKGVLCHHTAGPLQGNSPSLETVVDGRVRLAGPLAQLVLCRDGTFVIVAAGKCYHAGVGSWQGVQNGNTELIGIEAENTGLGNDPWPAAQLIAYQRGVAAILNHIGAGSVMCAGHKEYALPVGRKKDPSFDMNAFRAAVAGFMANPA